MYLVQEKIMRRKIKMILDGHSLSPRNYRIQKDGENYLVLFDCFILDQELEEIEGDLFEKLDDVIIEIKHLFSTYSYIIILPI